MSTTEIKIGGFGGQGVIMAGMIIGRGATIFENKFATLTQSFGPEARGSACSAQLIVSDEAVLYPYVTNPDLLVVMSQEAYRKFFPEMAPGGKLLYEEELIQLPPEVKEKYETYGVPATRLAEEIGRKIVLNLVMTGFFTAISDVLSADAMRSSIRESVPPGTETLNLLAFERGYSYGLKLLD
jgi:2-oxoglutarate ferredoxin oxidoreductase subunit gamma